MKIVQYLISFSFSLSFSSHQWVSPLGGDVENQIEKGMESERYKNRELCTVHELPLTDLAKSGQGQLLSCIQQCHNYYESILMGFGSSDIRALKRAARMWRSVSGIRTDRKFCQTVFFLIIIESNKIISQELQNPRFFLKFVEKVN